MTPQEKAESLGIRFSKQTPGYLAMVVRTGNLLMTSGHVSDMKGKLGAGLTVEQGKVAAAPQNDLGGGAVGLEAHAHQDLALLAKFYRARRIDGGRWRHAISRLALEHDERR